MVHIGSVFDQEADSLGLPVGDGKVERGHAFVRGLIDSRSQRHQSPQLWHIALGGSIENRFLHEAIIADPKCQQGWHPKNECRTNYKC